MSDTQNTERNETNTNTPAQMMQKIGDHLSGKDCVVQVNTCLKSTLFEHKHRAMIRLSKDGGSLLMQRGRNWDDISGANIRFGRIQ